MSNTISAGPLNFQEVLGLGASSYQINVTYDGSTPAINKLNGEQVTTVILANIRTIAKRGRAILINRQSQKDTMILNFGEKKNILKY